MVQIILERPRADLSCGENLEELLYFYTPPELQNITSFLSK